MRLPRACVSHRHASLIGKRLYRHALSQACISHRNASLTGVRNSQERAHGDISVKHNSAKHAKADMIGVVYNRPTPTTIPQRPKTKALPSHFCLHYFWRGRELCSKWHKLSLGSGNPTCSTNRTMTFKHRLLQVVRLVKEQRSRGRRSKP
jgi:hypothetical protein